MSMLRTGAEPRLEGRVAILSGGARGSGGSR